MNADEKIIIGLAIVYVAVYIIFYPSFFSSADEHEYLYNTYLLQRNSLIVEDKMLTPFGHFNGKGYISSYYIGKSIFLIPFTWFGWKFVFLSGLIIHLLNTYIFYNILKRSEIDTAGALLFLLYPAFVWNSRTLGNELLILTFILGAFNFYISSKESDHILSGIMFGLACLVRYETLLAFVPFAASSLLQKKRKCAYLILGFAPLALLILLFNNTYYGGWFGTGYSLGVTMEMSSSSKAIWYYFSKANELFLKNILWYALLLLLIYPLMLINPFFHDKKGRIEILVVSLIYIIFYSQKSGISTYPILSLVTMTAHLRYHIPVIGLLLIGYIPFYKRVLEKLRIPEKPVFWAAILMLFVGGSYGAYIHKDFQDGRRAVFEQIYAHTEEGSLIIGTGDTGSYVMPGVFGDRRYLDLRDAAAAVRSYPHGKIYVIDLRYTKGNVDPTHPRQKIVEATYQEMEDFIEKNSASLLPLYSAEKPHYLRIYRFTA